MTDPVLTVNLDHVRQEPHFWGTGGLYAASTISDEAFRHRALLLSDWASGVAMHLTLLAYTKLSRSPWRTRGSGDSCRWPCVSAHSLSPRSFGNLARGKLTSSWFSTRAVLLQVLVVESRSQSNDAFASTGIARESSQPRSHSSSDGGPSDGRPENSE